MSTVVVIWGMRGVWLLKEFYLIFPLETEHFGKLWVALLCSAVPRPNDYLFLVIKKRWEQLPPLYGMEWNGMNVGKVLQKLKNCFNPPIWNVQALKQKSGLQHVYYYYYYSLAN